MSSVPPSSSAAVPSTPTAAPTRSTAPAAPEPDLTARARIRDAAIARFAEHGVGATSVRSIAAAAGVSPALVIHHFGSKVALRVACDQHVAGLIREGKHAAAAQGPGLDPLAALRDAEQGPPLLRYLARTLVDGSPHVAELVDELVEDAVGYLAAGIETGMLKPVDDLRGCATVITLWSLGSVVLHEHVTRLTGVDLLGAPAAAAAWVIPATEILAKGLLDEAIHERVRDAFAAAGEDEP